MTLTELLACWGAIISTIALTWNFVLYLNDKAKFRVIAGILQNENKKDVFLVNIINIGRKPGVINSIYFQEKNSKKIILIIPHNLPKKILETENHIEIYDNLDIFKNLIKNIWVFDSTGKNWFVSKKYLKNLNKKIKPQNDKAI